MKIDQGRTPAAAAAGGDSTPWSVRVAGDLLRFVAGLLAQFDPSFGRVAAVTGQLELRHRGTLVATHAILTGKYQVVILPEHGPGPIARTQRALRTTPAPPRAVTPVDVVTRDLQVHEALCAGGAR